ncbi:fibronectin type III-like domain-contianing protein, partial [Streptomyces sp. PSKA30]|uniref:fibronectin type III-like domain-contianing protein n=1 Tax=Streptomyces sp. PSKA30 TaxID=2874597 RepID=UPI001CD10A58
PTPDIRTRRTPDTHTCTSEGARRQLIDRSSQPFGHGLGYTDWTYESVEVEGTTVRVRLRNSGERPGREVVQVYLAPSEPDPERPARRLVGFAWAEAAPGERVEVTVDLPPRAFEIWDKMSGSWSFVKGSHEIQIGRSITDRRLTAAINV